MQPASVKNPVKPAKPTPVPESILKKRKTLEQIKAKRAEEVSCAYAQVRVRVFPRVRACCGACMRLSV